MPETTQEVVRYMTKPNHHEIKIHLVGGVSVKADKDPVLHVGDTVCYASPNGKARVVFPSGSPYAVSQVADAGAHKLLKAGRFQFQCFVTPTGQTVEIGWDPKNPQAGGVHDVVDV
jgi:hypothetical protein